MNTAILDEIIALATPHRSSAEVLDLALGIILPSFGQAVGAAYLIQGQAAHLVAQRGWDIVQALQPALSLDGMDAQSGLYRARVFRPSRLGSPDLTRTSQGWVIESLALLPLDRHSQCGFLLIGVPYLLAPTKARSGLLSTIGYTVGLAIRDAEQRIATRDASPERMLLDLCRALASMSNLELVLELIVYTAVQATQNATSGAMYFVDSPEELAADPPSSTSSRGAATSQIDMLALGRRVAQEALDAGQVVDIEDVAEDDRFAGMAPRLPNSSLLVAPIQTATRAIGVLIIESQSTRAFTPDDEHRTMSLATIAAEAIEHQQPSNLEQSPTSEWNHLVCSDFCRLLLGVAHDLRNPLTAVMGYAQLLGAMEGQDSLTLRDLDKIQNQAQRAAQIVNNLSGFARHCGSQNDPTHLNEVLKPVLALHARSLEAQDIRLDTDLSSHDVCVNIDSSQLQYCVLRLISHIRAALSSPARGGYVRVNTELDGDRVRLACTFGPSALSADSIEPQRPNAPLGVPEDLDLCTALVQKCGGSVLYLDAGDGARTWVAELPPASKIA